MAKSWDIPLPPEFTSWNGHLAKITVQLAGGTEADIMQINWPWLPLFSKNGTGFADLNDYKDIIDLSQWSESELAATSVKGHLQGLPLSITGRVPWFNKTTYDKAGLPLPKTWNDLLAAAKVFQEKLGDDYYPYEATGLTSHGLGRPRPDPRLYCSEEGRHHDRPRHSGAELHQGRFHRRVESLQDILR